MRTVDDIHDELLVIRCREGHQDALAELVDRWQPRLFRQAMRLVGRADAAADVVQEAWLAIVRGLRRLDDPARFRPWAYRIVTNKCTDWIRRRQRQRAKMRSLVEEPAAAPSRVDDTEDEVAALIAAIKELPKQQKATLAMFYIDGMSIRQIAEVLLLPEGTVKSRLHHARGRLKQVLERREP